MIVFPGDGFERLLELFDRLEIPYMIGGSGASSVHGLVRTTGDLDIVAKIAVLGVIAVQRQNLDVRYLRDWAEYLGISKLLEQALQEGQASH